MPQLPRLLIAAMTTVEIITGEVAALPNAASFDGSATVLACTDAAAAYRVLRSIMDYGYANAEPQHITLVCANEDIAKAYRFQWNMWYAERKPG